MTTLIELVIVAVLGIATAILVWKLLDAAVAAIVDDYASYLCMGVTGKEAKNREVYRSAQGE